MKTSTDGWSAEKKAAAKQMSNVLFNLDQMASGLKIKVKEASPGLVNLIESIEMAKSIQERFDRS